jgi:hypothetical protein
LFFNAPIPFVEILYNYFNSFKVFKGLKTFREVFNYYKKLPPKILIYGEGSHQESREVWKEYKNVEKPKFKDIVEYADENVEIITTYYVGNYKEKELFEYESDWGRTSQGGGKMDKSMENKRNVCQKSVEIQTFHSFNKEREYKYESWEDITIENDEFFKSDYPALIVDFKFEIHFDKEAKDDLIKLTDELKKEGIKVEKEINLKFLTITRCPGLPNCVKCYTDESGIKKIKYDHMNIITIIVWIFFAFLGYSSITDPYFIKEYEYGNKTIKYTKFVSGTKDYRAGYMRNDEDSYFLEKKNAQSVKDKKGKLKNDNNLGKDEDNNMLELGENLI